MRRKHDPAQLETMLRIAGRHMATMGMRGWEAFCIELFPHTLHLLGKTPEETEENAKRILAMAAREGGYLERIRGIYASAGRELKRPRGHRLYVEPPIGLLIPVETCLEQSFYDEVLEDYKYHQNERPETEEVPIQLIPAYDSYIILEGNYRCRIAHDKGRKTVRALLAPSPKSSAVASALINAKRGIRHVADLPLLRDTEYERRYSEHDELDPVAELSPFDR